MNGQYVLWNGLLSMIERESFGYADIKVLRTKQRLNVAISKLKGTNLSIISGESSNRQDG